MSAPPTPPTPAERFARCIRDLRGVIAAQGLAIRLPSPLILLVWARIRRLAFRFAQSAANPPRPRKPRPADAKPQTAKPPREPAATGEPHLPTGYAWLRRLIPDHRINFCVGAIRDILENPEMAALIAATPTAGRALRPLCHILGIPLPLNLRLPPRPKPEKPANPQPKPRIASRKHPLVRDAIAPNRPTAARPQRRAHPRAPPAWL